MFLILWRDAFKAFQNDLLRSTDAFKGVNFSCLICQVSIKTHLRLEQVSSDQIENLRTNTILLRNLQQMCCMKGCVDGLGSIER